MSLAQSYWSESGKHQKLYDAIKDLVPDSGESDDPNIELLRCGGNVYYDCYNNGGGNFDVLTDQLDFVLENENVVSKVDPKVWARFNDTIVTHRDQLIDPEDEEIECDECSGDGKIECDECCGSGEITCDECDGSGEINDEECPTCDGVGEVECVHCFGDGDEDCFCCDGSGEVEGTANSCLDDSSGWEGPLESVMDTIILIVSESLTTIPDKNQLPLFKE